MKDYYYFLGIPNSASSEDIKRAYRKLSLKYHPDKNADDVFFEQRFREVQEAYETLINPEKRRLFDQNLNHQQKDRVHSFPPYIKSFTTNKIRVRKGEKIIISWKTQNADVVKILPFGLEKPSGDRMFKITEFKEGKFHLILHATNSYLNKTVVHGITITEIFESNIECFQSEEVEKLFSQKQNNQDMKQILQHPLLLRILIFFIIVAIAVYLLLRC